MIMKALVELDGPRSQPFKAFAEQREKWMVHDMYRAPGKLLAKLTEWCCGLELRGVGWYVMVWYGGMIWHGMVWYGMV